MAKQHLLLAVVLTTAYILHTASSAANITTTAADEAETVYDVLHQNKLPRGLLPQGVVQSYVVHVGGALDVTLPGECSFSVEADGKAYRFRYARHVGGVLVNMSIAHTYGIKMELGYTWFDVGEMRCAGDRLKVELPVSTQWFPLIAFAQSPRCD